MNQYFFECGKIYDCEDGRNAVLICDPYLSYKHAQFSSGCVIMIDQWADKVIGYNGETATPNGYNEEKTNCCKAICEVLAEHYWHGGAAFPAMYNITLQRDGKFLVSWTALNIGSPKSFSVSSLEDVKEYTRRYPTEEDVYKNA